MFNSLTVFIVYAPEDEVLRKKLEIHLATLQREGAIQPWHSGKIIPGEEWEQHIKQKLEAAQIILLLISSDFIASDACYNEQMQQAIQQHRTRKSRVIPVLLRPADWESTQFRRFRVLPENAMPVTTWSNQDEAFLSVVKGLRKVTEEMRKGIISISDIARISPQKILGIAGLLIVFYIVSWASFELGTEKAGRSQREEIETFVPSESINEGEAISLIGSLYSLLSAKQFDEAMSLYTPQLAESFSPGFFSQFERVTVEDLQITFRTDSSINFIGQNTYAYPDGSTQRETRSYTVSNLSGELKITASEFIKVTKFR